MNLPVYSILFCYTKIIVVLVDQPETCRNPNSLSDKSITQQKILFLNEPEAQTHSRGFLRTSSNLLSSDPSRCSMSGQYSHRAVSGRLISTLSIRAPGVINLFEKEEGVEKYGSMLN